MSVARPAGHITIPPDIHGLTVVASVSGGKDSTAMIIALKEADVEFRAVFADTGWEAPETYDYLDLLRQKICPIEVVKPKRDMVEAVKHRAGFPARMQRWCTRKLKLSPLRAYHDALETETASAVGIRANESLSRSKMVEWEDDHEWGGFIWRPILNWTVEDVILIHRKHNIPMNPLYHRGHDRVGCYPCIFSSKEEISLLPEWRIEQIEQLENEVTAERRIRNTETPGRYASEIASFFQTKNSKAGGVMQIREVQRWARTSRGGRQYQLLQEPPSGGCMRWGLCETAQRPTAHDEVDA